MKPVVMEPATDCTVPLPSFPPPQHEDRRLGDLMSERWQPEATSTFALGCKIHVRSWVQNSGRKKARQPDRAGECSGICEMGQPKNARHHHNWFDRYHF